MRAANACCWLAIVGAGCTEAEPEGRLVVSWTLERIQELSCVEALIDGVRVEAVHVDHGERASSGVRACADGAAEIAVSGGTYLVTIDTLGSMDETIDHAERVMIVAASGETPAAFAVPTSLPAARLHARWTAPCGSGDRMSLHASGEFDVVGTAACGAGELTSDEISWSRSGVATLEWTTANGVNRGYEEWPYEITARNQIIELAPASF